MTILKIARKSNKNIKKTLSMISKLNFNHTSQGYM